MNALILTAHDYRTPRKANMHFIARELARRGDVRFLSLRYSRLSKWKRDPRVELDDRANRVEHVDGVDCYLAKSLVHPFNTRRPWLRAIEDAAFRWSQAHPPEILRRWIADADVVFIESGSPILHAALAERIRPSARRIYIASDDLATIEVAPFVRDEFERTAARLDALCLPSPLLREGMPAGARCYFVPHGLDADIASRAGPDPYAGAVAAVSVGSMLFDREFFELAASACPDVHFHVIGSGLPSDAIRRPNVVLHGEMAYEDTLAYIKHARVGIAPYRGDGLPVYLADTSMKMMQYRFFEIPTVCPEAVVGSAQDRFGYRPGDRESIRHAMRAALETPRADVRRVLGWDEVVDRLLRPEDFDDTRFDASPPVAVPARRRA